MDDSRSTLYEKRGKTEKMSLNGMPQGDKMKMPKAFGIWTLEESNSDIETIPEEQPSEINGKAAYCPFCKKQMKMWLEGCTLWHIYCKDCDFCLDVTTENEEIFEKLVAIIHE